MTNGSGIGCRVICTAVIGQSARDIRFALRITTSYPGVTDPPRRIYGNIGASARTTPPFNPNGLSRSAVMEALGPPVHPDAILSSATLPPSFLPSLPSPHLPRAVVTQVSNSIISGRRFTGSGQSIPFVHPPSGLVAARS